MVYILFAILFFGFLVAIHELGHFLVAKLCNVRVNEFAIGMGPRLLHKQGKETEYSLRLFPVGGYCAMEGEDEETDDPRCFAAAAAWKRFLILVAGSGMNFIAGLLILVCIFSANKTQVTPVIDSFMAGNPAAAEGYLQVGDEFLKIDGQRVLVASDVSMLLGRGDGESVDLVIRRNGEKLTLEDVPLQLLEYEVNGEVSLMYGLYFRVTESNLLSNTGLALRAAVNFARMVWFSVMDLLSGSAGLRDLSGPVGIVSAMSDVGEASGSVVSAILNLLYFGSFIAVNLAVMNLLPLPALDGGRLLFLVLNVVLAKVIRRTIPGKYESYVHLAGMALLLALMALVAVNDVFRIVGG